MQLHIQQLAMTVVQLCIAVSLLLGDNCCWALGERLKPKKVMLPIPLDGVLTTPSARLLLSTPGKQQHANLRHGVQPASGVKLIVRLRPDKERDKVGGSHRPARGDFRCFGYVMFPVDPQWLIKQTTLPCCTGRGKASC